MYQFMGILLSGGASRRFGEPKAFYQYNGQPLFSYSLQSLKSQTEKIIIISRPDQEKVYRQATDTDVVVMNDDPAYKGMGPLAGLYTAMSHYLSEWYIVLPCDTPFIDDDLIRYLKNHLSNKDPCDGVVPFANGYKQPLIAIYHRRLLPNIRHLLETGSLRLDRLLQLANIHLVYPEKDGFSSRLFENINTKQQIENVENVNDQYKIDPRDSY